jgi:cold-inducible RNA-binding protein
VKVYLGNLSKDMNDAQLNDLVQSFGTPERCEVAKDRETGASKGFGFVTYGNDDHARAAIAGLDGKEVDGRTLKVSEARSKKDGQ